MDKNKKFTIVLKTLRKQKGLSQESLAEKASINEKYFGQIERGESSPTLKKLFKICDALELDVSEFMNFVDDCGKKL